MSDVWELNVKFNDYHYKVKGSEKVVSQHISLAMGHARDNIQVNADTLQLELAIQTDSPDHFKKILPESIVPSENKLSEAAFNSDKIKPFIHQLGTRIEWIFALGMGYYLSEYMNEPMLSAANLKDLYRIAGIAEPKNIHLSVNQCVKKGYFNEIGKVEKVKTYIISDAGKQFIEKQIKAEKPAFDELTYESDAQKNEILRFIQHLSDEEINTLKLQGDMSQRILLMMYMLKIKTLHAPIRPNFVYILMIKLFGYEGLKRSVHLGLSRTRPMTRKLKINNQVHYELTPEGEQYAAELYEKTCSSV
ncbi:hypothetical protein [Jeotgalibacillus sp. JSM ZJ347]|uniref:hypothetical protein n=1 Tax=Jeotgalibacillus sp. JSM ZJ347 TaxID=3342117 RepID=UPI0035A861BE